MQRHTLGSLVWLTFDLFTDFPQLIHGIFLRHGGSSSGEFDSLNFGLIQGDLTENVQENWKRALDALKISSYCRLWQSHGKTIVQADPQKKQEGDGLTTNQPGIGLAILHADCQAAIFYDPVHHALSNIHCGWRGNVQNIYKETIIKMQEFYGSHPQDILVGISPSLSPTASEFINFQRELPVEFHSFQIQPNYFDLWAISRWQLLEAGILPNHIEISEICTYSNPQDFFSYRRVKASGRHATIAYLN